MAGVFWESEGTVLVELLKRGATATVNWERCVQTLKKLKPRIRWVWPNRKTIQFLIFPTIPTEHQSSILLSFWRMHFDDAVWRTTKSWNTACVKKSDAATKSFYATDPHARLGKLCFNEGELVETQSQICKGIHTICVNFIINITLVSKKNVRGVTLYRLS